LKGGTAGSENEGSDPLEDSELDNNKEELVEEAHEEEIEEILSYSRDFVCLCICIRIRDPGQVGFWLKTARSIGICKVGTIH
jgi:hypothetical protein